MNTILEKKEEKETEEIINFVKDLKEEEKKEIYIFIQGIKFSKSLVGNRAS